MAEEEHRFPCDACGSDMRFDPGDDRLICDHCGNVQAIETVGPWARRQAIAEQDFRAAVEARLSEAEMEVTRVTSCPSCGATFEFDPDEHAAECPFCATPVVGGTGTDRHIKPRAVLPFVLEEAAAHEAMTAWLGRLWFAPGGLSEYARHGRKLSGIYTPAWTFDAETQSAYSGERGTAYYETQTVVRDGKRQQVQVRKIRWRPTRGQVARFFDDVLIVASSALPERFRKATFNWDLSALEPYQPMWLAGFRSEAYTVDIEAAFGEARAIMDRQILRDVKFDIGGDAQRVHDVQTEVSDVTFKHILLPLWLAAYKYRGKSYRFVVNGQSGEVTGERPWSAWKIAAAVVLGGVVAAGLGYLYAEYGG